MKDKFTMGLVWHNCKTYPPSETYNSSLLATDGNDVCPMLWNKPEGYWLGGIARLSEDELEQWYWADVPQTVKKCAEFKEVVADGH